MKDDRQNEAAALLRGMNRARTISIIGLLLAFLASAFSVLTGNLSTRTVGRMWTIITVLLWLVAVTGMILWLYGRGAMRRAAAGGGWLAQSVPAAPLDDHFTGACIYFKDHLEAEEKYGECIRSLRSRRIGSPVRLDLSWLKGEEGKPEYVIAAFSASPEISPDNLLVESLKGELHSATNRLVSGPEVRAEYFRKLGGCGASMWIEQEE